MADISAPTSHDPLMSLPAGTRVEEVASGVRDGKTSRNSWRNPRSKCVATCAHCGGEFRCPASMVGVLRFCGTECRKAYPFSAAGVEKRFWSKVDRRGPSECWLWKGTRSCGYGVFFDKRRGRNGRAHRFSFELANGPIAPGLYVCHSCDVPQCVNPAHLFAGTHDDNMRDAKLKGRLSHPAPWNRHKLTSEQVREIRHRGLTESARLLAAEFGVNEHFARGIVKGRERVHD